MEPIWADGGYTGIGLIEYRFAALVLMPAIVKRSDDQKGFGFAVLPKRRIVERSSRT